MSLASSLARPLARSLASPGAGSGGGWIVGELSVDNSTPDFGDNILLSFDGFLTDSSISANDANPDFGNNITIGYFDGFLAGSSISASDANPDFDDNITIGYNAVTLTYVWKKAGLNESLSDAVVVDGATTDELAINGVAITDQGRYWLTVTAGARSKTFGAVEINIVSAPRAVVNLIGQTGRFITGWDSGTGDANAETITKANSVKYGTLDCDTGSLGRAYWTATITLPSTGFYAFSFEVLDHVNLASNVWQNSGGTATITGTPSVTGANITSGGNGRYVVVFECTGAGTIIPRVGQGLSSNTINRRIKIQNLQLEKVATGSSPPGEYVYAGYSAAFNYANPNSVSSSKVTTTAQAAYTLRDYSHIIGVGDSKSDEIIDLPAALDKLFKADNFGVVQVHARGGWRAAAVIEFVVDDYNMTIGKAIAGTLQRRTFSTAGDEQFADNQGVEYNTLLISNLGVNDIVNDVDNSVTLANIATIAEAAVAAGLKVIITSLTPFSSGPGWTEGRQTVLESYNAALSAYATANGHMYVNIYDAVGDSEDATELAAEFSADGLHLNEAGGVACAEEIESDVYTEVGFTPA